MVQWIAIWGIVAIAAAALAGFVAAYKRLDHSFWIGWSFIFPPMLLILLVMPRNRGPRAPRKSLDEQEAAQDN